MTDLEGINNGTLNIRPEIQGLIQPLDKKVIGLQASWATLTVLSASGESAVYPQTSEVQTGNRTDIVAAISIDTPDLFPLLEAARNQRIIIDDQEFNLSQTEVLEIERSLRVAMEFYWGAKLMHQVNRNARAEANQNEFLAVMEGSDYEDYLPRFWTQLWEDKSKAQEYLNLIVKVNRQLKNQDDEILESPTVLIADFKKAYADKLINPENMEAAGEIVAAYERTTSYMNFHLMVETVRIIREELGFKDIKEFLSFMHGEDIYSVVDRMIGISSLVWIPREGERPGYFGAYEIARRPISDYSGKGIQDAYAGLAERPLVKEIQRIIDELSSSLFNDRASTYVGTALFTFLPDYIPEHLVALASEVKSDTHTSRIPLLQALVENHRKGIRTFDFIRQILGQVNPIQMVDYIRQRFHERGHLLETKLLMHREKKEKRPQGNLRIKTNPIAREMMSMMNEALGSPEFSSVWAFLTPLNALRFLNEMDYWYMAEEAFLNGRYPNQRDLREQMDKYSAAVQYALGCKDFPKGRILDNYGYWAPSTNSIIYVYGAIVGPILVNKLAEKHMTNPNKAQIKRELGQYALAIAKSNSWPDLKRNLKVKDSEIQAVIDNYRGLQKQ